MKRICTLLLCVAVMMISVIPMCVTASAAGYLGCLLDYDDCFTDDQELVVRELLVRTAQSAGCNVGVVVSGDLGGESPLRYTDEILVSTFGADSDSIVLLLNNDFDSAEYFDWISFSGSAADRYHDETAGIFDEIYRLLETDGYLGAVVGFCNYLGLGGSGMDDVLPEDTAEPAQTAEPEKPADNAAYKAVLDDRHDMLSDNAEAELKQYMRSIAAEIECHVGIVITADLQGMSDRKFAENFAKEVFSYGSDLVVLLINNDRSHEEYTDWIYTYGLGTEKFDPAVDGIFDALYDGMGDYQADIADYDYYSGIMNFCYALGDISENGDYSYYFSYNSDDDYYDSGDDGFPIFVPVIISGIVTVVVLCSVTAGYSMKKPISARHYMDAGRTRFLDRKDIYLRETTTSVKISSSSSGGGSRGGGGGRSRSGGGGGGGRRR